MRLSTLLLLLLALLLLAAPAASVAQTTRSSKAGVLFDRDSAAVIHPDGNHRASADRATSHWQFDEMNSEPVCLTMRTYVVARDNPGSDSTHVAGYHECLPAWQFDLRTSELKQPSDELR